MKKKILLTIGTLATIASPITAIIACSPPGEGGSNSLSNDSKDLYDLNAYLVNKINNLPKDKKDMMPSELKVTTSDFITKLFEIDLKDPEWISKSKGITFSDLKLTPWDKFGQLDFSFSMHKGSETIVSDSMELKGKFLNTNENKEKQDRDFLDGLGKRVKIFSNWSHNNGGTTPIFEKEQNYIYLETKNSLNFVNWRVNASPHPNWSKGRSNWIWEDPKNWPEEIKGLKGPWYFPRDKDKFNQLLTRYADISPNSLPKEFDGDWQITKIYASENDTNFNDKYPISSVLFQDNIFNPITNSVDHGTVFLRVEAQKGKAIKDIYIAINGWAEQ